MPDSGCPVPPHAFARLYREHYPAIVGYLYRRTADHALAEDLAADTFLAAWKALPAYRDLGIPFHAWLLRIATNRANAVARRDRVRRRVFGLFRPAPQPSTTSPADTLTHALARLSPEHQSVIALVHLEGLSVGHAARVLGVPEGTVKSRLHRARETLRAVLALEGIHR